jgi:hypothetical protein
MWANQSSAVPEGRYIISILENVVMIAYTIFHAGLFLFLLQY